MDNASELFYSNNAQFAPEKRLSDAKNGDHFVIEDLLDFPSDDVMVAVDGRVEAAAMDGTSTDSCNSSTAVAEPVHFHVADAGGPRGGHFSGEICVPYDDMAEWLSNFEEESFSSEDLQKLHLIQGISGAHHAPSQPETARPGPIIRSEVPVPAKARSKHSRAAPVNWTSRLLAVAPPPPPTASSSSEPAAARPSVQKKTDGPGLRPDNNGPGPDGRRCLHCATDKTPQWRTGPLGPKTLCNACGVRYKSGRLVPEYRPASSPTFVLTKHSNSHRKVLELRRQKDVVRAQQHQQQQQFVHHHHHHHQGMMFDVSNGDDYLIHQHIGPDFRQLI